MTYDYSLAGANWQPQVRNSDLPGIRAAQEPPAYFNPPPIEPSKVKRAISGITTTASGDHRLGRFR